MLVGGRVSSPCKPYDLSEDGTDDHLHGFFGGGPMLPLMMGLQECFLDATSIYFSGSSHLRVGFCERYLFSERCLCRFLGFLL